MRRAPVALMIAILILGGGSVALIAWWTREWQSPDPYAARPPPEEPAAADVPARSPAGAAVPAGMERPRRAEPLAAETARQSRNDRVARAGATAATRGSLVSFRREMKAGFAAIQRRVARCGATDAWFTLDVETVEGGVRVVEVHLEHPGSNGDAAVACARSLLLGETIAAPSARPGRRWQLSFAPGPPM